MRAANPHPKSAMALCDRGVSGAADANKADASDQALDLVRSQCPKA
jgi:hypothetical protein